MADAGDHENENDLRTALDYSYIKAESYVQFIFLANRQSSRCHFLAGRCVRT